MNLTRVLGIPAVVLVGSMALAGCTAGEKTDDSGSIAVVEKFFAHLESGEASAAAALTEMDFPEELIDDKFYAASAALPSDSRILQTEGYDGGGFSATVQYVLDDPSEPVTLEVTVGELEDELRVSGWRFNSPLRIGPVPAAGVVTVNEQLEYTLAEEGNELLLLPAIYSFTYNDPTGLLLLNGGEGNSFTAAVPGSDTVSIVPSFLPDVVPAVRDNVERLQSDCEEEAFTGPSCPTELIDAMKIAQDSGPVTVEWFREAGADIVWKDGSYESTMSYRVHSEQLPQDVVVSYTGAVTRNSAGDVVFTP